MDNKTATDKGGLGILKKHLRKLFCSNEEMDHSMCNKYEEICSAMEEYASQPQRTCVWVDDRLPTENKKYVVEMKDGIRREMYFDDSIPTKWLYTNQWGHKTENCVTHQTQVVKWLSSCGASSGEGEAVEFANWISNHCEDKQGTIGYPAIWEMFDTRETKTTEEIYAMFKSKPPQSK